MINKWLYKKDAKGKLRKWMVDVDYNMERLVIHHGAEGGEIQVKYEYIDEGKGGRDIDEQLESRALSRANNKIDSGYVNSPEGADAPITNSLGLPRPMLAQPSEGKINKIDWSLSFVQRKYNGHRCLIKKDGDKVIAYSRKGKLINTIPHITDIVKSLPNGTILDGELYIHGESLQKLGSLIKRAQPESKKLAYHVYDVMRNEKFADRLNWLTNNIDQGFQSIGVVETLKVSNIEQVNHWMRAFRDEGYEGLILRHGTAKYEDSKRSRSLLKFKEWFDDEFAVVSIDESKDGWAILNFVSKSGKEFSASAPGTMEDRYHVAENKSEYVGFSVNVQYAELTADGVPFHPVATGWRERGE